MCSLQIIKDFYLLGRGELYQVFIDLAQQMLKTLPTAVTEHGQCDFSRGTSVATGHVTLRSGLFSQDVLDSTRTFQCFLKTISSV